MVPDLPAIMEKKAHVAVDILLPSPNDVPSPEENMATSRNIVVQPDTSLEINNHTL